MLILSRRDVEELLDLDELRKAVAAAMVEVSAGRVSMPPRIAAQVDEIDAFMAVMPAYVPALGALTTKIVDVFPQNAGGPHDTHQAVIVAADPATGIPTALIEAASVTAARTAAGSALAVEHVARPDATVLAILGTGVQARSHAEAVARVRELTEIRIAGRDLGRARALADELSGVLACTVLGVALDQACAGADIVCATTHAADPVVRREDLAPGVHVCSVGLNYAGREVDSRTVADALVVVESRDSALGAPPAGANDLRVPIEEGLLDPDRVVEIGEIVAGIHPGRTSVDQITLYKSVGVAAQDAAAAALLLAAARARGVGIEVDLD